MFIISKSMVTQVFSKFIFMTDTEIFLAVSSPQRFIEGLKMTAETQCLSQEKCKKKKRAQ